ncbi:hypothetical protein [Hymenobacter sp. GOD-10R]|uniref:hypothetical protein n=1 Tax=Hymenobacter sp. GOD-10R TaxID=3093922 RepID=UPI002D76F26A|nr:hypothetical protein [Hymenobacter sp. GOD-10R]WRQ31200.1 hypothetical protein SD425_13110 [Hymenobacter sp. GOD-10R]
MIRLYLDIDGVLLTTKHTQAAVGVDAFIDFVTSNFDCYWLTTHCKGDSATALRYVARFLEPTIVEKLSKAVQPTNWDALKTDAVDMRSDFYWLDDCPLQVEVAQMRANGVDARLILVDLNRTDELLKIQMHLQGIHQLND